MKKRCHSQRSVVTVHDDEGFVATPVQHISSAAGSTTISTEHVMVPLSPQKVVIMQGHVPEFSDVLGDGYDADADDDPLGTIHYIKAPRAKHYPNAVSQLTISNIPVFHPFVRMHLGCASS